MAEKELGYVELVWTCPNCKTRNPGTTKMCGGCGNPQPKDVQFETADAAEFVQEQAKIEQAKAGPDIHCGFCGARNPSTAKVCHQCSADLTAGKARETGQVIGAYDPNAPKEVKCASCGMMNPAAAVTCARCGSPLGKPAPAPVPAPAAPLPKSGGSSMTFIFIGIAVVVVLGICGLVFFSLQTDSKTATATQARWERRIDIMAPIPVRASAWQDQLPARANNVSCRQEYRYSTSQPQPGAREVCGTPYTVDTGTGMGRVVQDCEYQVYDDYCSYTTLQLSVINTVASHGVGFSPDWPALNLTGDQQIGARNERYYCDLTDGEKNYTYTVQTLAQYQQCREGSKWNIEVNSFGSMVSAELAE